jgi:hypothetical protein
VTSVSSLLPEAQPMAKASIMRMIVSRTPAATALSYSRNDACTSLGTPGGGPNLDTAAPVPYLGETRAWKGDATWKRLDRASVEVLVGGKV